MFLQSFFQESDCDIGADAVASGSGIAKSNDSVDQADGAEAVDLGRVQACALDGVVGADQGCHRVLVSLKSWPGQLLSLYPCLRPKILARMLFLRILSLEVVILDITAYLIIDCEYW